LTATGNIAKAGGVGFFSNSLSKFKFTLKNSIIKQNKAILDGGGAFYTYHQTEITALFENALFVENISIKGSGGVFYFIHLEGNFSFIDCNFTKN
jgi:hypothetical protein